MALSTVELKSVESLSPPLVIGSCGSGPTKLVFSKLGGYCRESRGKESTAADHVQSVVSATFAACVSLPVASQLLIQGLVPPTTHLGQLQGKLRVLLLVFTR